MKYVCMYLFCSFFIYLFFLTVCDQFIFTSKNIKMSTLRLDSVNLVGIKELFQLQVATVVEKDARRLFSFKWPKAKLIR